MFCIRMKNHSMYLIGVVHAHGNTFALEVIYIHDGRRFSISRAVYELELPRSWCHEVRGTVLNRNEYMRYARSEIPYLVTNYVSSDF